MTVKINQFESIPEQFQLDIGESELSGLLEELFANSQNLPESIEISFISLGEIKKLNRETRQKDEPTDILSFPSPFEHGIGEIYISTQFILENSPAKNSEELQVELFRLLIHGILHTSGLDHTQKLPYGNEETADEAIYVEQERLLRVLLESLKRT